MTSLLEQTKTPNHNPRARIAAGFYATLIMLALMLVGRLTLGTPIVPELIADRLFAWLPIALVEFGVQTLGVVAVASFIYTFLGKFSAQIRRGIPGRVADGNGVFPNIEGLAMEVTPTADFYQVSKNIVDPDINVDGWSLEIDGLVDRPMQLSYADIKAMEAVEQYATLACISRVEVSTDGGTTWESAELKSPLSPYSWVLWQSPWTPRQAGKFPVLVRATDGRGEPQTDKEAEPIPDGASGYHQRTINVI